MNKYLENKLIQLKYDLHYGTFLLKEKRSYVARIESLLSEKEILNKSNGQNLILYEDLKVKMLEEVLLKKFFETGLKSKFS